MNKFYLNSNAMYIVFDSAIFVQCPYMYIRTAETDDTTLWGGFDGFAKKFRFRLKKKNIKTETVSKWFR